MLAEIDEEIDGFNNEIEKLLVTIEELETAMVVEVVERFPVVVEFSDTGSEAEGADVVLVTEEEVEVVEGGDEEEALKMMLFVGVVEMSIVDDKEEEVDGR